MSDKFDDGYDLAEVDEQVDETGSTKRSKKDNLKKGLAGSGRTLVGIFAMAILAVIGGAVLVMNSLGGPAPSSQSDLREAPKDSDGAPTGEGADPRYQELVREENEGRMQRARESGESAMPTLVDDAVVEDEIQVPGIDDQPAEEACSTKCQEMKAAQEEAEAARKQAEQQAASLRSQLDAMRQQQTEENGIRPNRIVYRDHLYLSQEAEQQRVDRMTGEMQQVAAVMTGNRTHGYAETADMGVNRDQSGNSQNGAGGQTGTEQTGQSGESGEGTQANEGGTNGSVIIPAGDIQYATLDLTANSDVPGPIRATIHGGEFDKSVLLGEFTREDKYLVMRFNSLTEPNNTRHSIDAIAVDDSTRTVGMADEVDRHLLLRYGTVFGTAFLQGVGQSLSTAIQGASSFGATPTGDGTTDTAAARREVIENIVKDYELHALSAMGQVGQKASEMAQPLMDKPPTVIKYADTGMAILFLDEVTAE